MQKIRLILTIALTGVVFALVTMAHPARSYASVFDPSKTEACSGAALQTAGCSGSTSATVDKVLKAVLGILSLVVGIISVIMLVIGGIRFITSQGDGNSINAARNTIIYALVGLVVVALAQAIVRFVIGKIT